MSLNKLVSMPQVLMISLNFQPDFTLKTKKKILDTNKPINLFDMIFFSSSMIIFMTFFFTFTVQFLTIFIIWCDELLNICEMSFYRIQIESFFLHCCVCVVSNYPI